MVHTREESSAVVDDDEGMKVDEYGGRPRSSATVRAYGRFGADCLSTPFMDIPFSYPSMSEFYSTSGLLLQTVLIFI